MRGREADRSKIDELLVHLSNLEVSVNISYRSLCDYNSALQAEIALLKRRIAQLEDEVKRVKSENQRLLSELQRARTVR